MRHTVVAQGDIGSDRLLEHASDGGDEIFERLCLAAGVIADQCGFSPVFTRGGRVDIGDERHKRGDLPSTRIVDLQLAGNLGVEVAYQRIELVLHPGGDDAVLDLELNGEAISDKVIGTYQSRCLLFGYRVETLIGARVTERDVADHGGIPSDDNGGDGFKQESLPSKPNR